MRRKPVAVDETIPEFSLVLKEYGKELTAILYTPNGTPVGQIRFSLALVDLAVASALTRRLQRTTGDALQRLLEQGHQPVREEGVRD